jgi:hypothetical protein
MTNPLDSGGSNGGGGYGNDLQPGETRVILAKAKDGTVLKTIVLHRTNRPYVMDLCDAYNDARTVEALRRGVEWYVNAAGALRIGIAVDDPEVRALHHQQ